jgi:hypothetical protein
MQARAAETAKTVVALYSVYRVVPRRTVRLCTSIPEYQIIPVWFDPFNLVIEVYGRELDFLLH